MDSSELLDFQNELLNKLAVGAGLQELAEYTGALIHKSVLITNPSQRILASTSFNKGFNQGELLRVSKIDPSSQRATVLSGEQELDILAFELNSLKRLGFLLIFDPGADETGLIKRVGLLAKMPCVLELQKQHELLESKRHYQDVFLFDLLYGNMEDPADIIALGEIWGWNLQLPQVVTVLELEDFEPHSADTQWVEMITEIVRSVLEYHDIKAALMKKNEEVVVILPVEEQSRRSYKAYITMLLNQIEAQLEGRLEQRQVRIGVGRKYIDPTEIFRSYQEAKVALKLGYLLPEQTRTSFFMELGVERILYNHELQDLQEFYRETLEDLDRFDKAQKNDLMETLETYIAHRCDLKRTADALFVHKNTLRYRLKKIEEILEINIEDFNDILSLMLAFKIKYLKKV